MEVAVEYSTVNYKDGLILTGQKGVVRNWPLVPGIDYAGRVVRSRSPLWKEGDAVLLTGNKAGQFFDGGYAERASCQAEWLVGVPEALGTRGAMVLGSAGMTAMMCVLHLERFGGLTPSSGPVLVTGAAGGLGQVAVTALARRGYEVIASTGRVAEHEGRLRELGARQVVGRLDAPRKPLDTQLYAGVVDSVGGPALSAALSRMAYRGALASTGLAGGAALETTVFPLILRGVRLLGVDSTLPWNLEGYSAAREHWEAWRAERLDVWDELLSTLHLPTDLDLLNAAAGEVGLTDLASVAPEILNGRVAGRLVVNLARD